MSSTECVLQNARPERPGEFTFTWSIHNYSYGELEEGDCFKSPDFEVEFLGDAKWCLLLFPRGDSVTGFISFGLCNLLNRYEGSNFNFSLSIRKANGQFDEGSETIFKLFTANGYLKFISCVELMQSDRYLVNDTLTLRCRIWKTDVDIPASMNWEAHSRIKVSKLDYTFIINGVSVTNQEFVNDFNKTVDVTEFFTKVTKTNLQVFKKGCLCDGAIQFGLVIEQPKKDYFWKAGVHLIDANGKVAHSARSEHLFESSGQMLEWNFPLISKEVLYHNKLQYMPKNQLKLRCELGFATDNELQTFRITNEVDFESSTIGQESDLQKVWIKNMHQCYENKLFTDFMIRTPASQFPVSRNILSAHSEVFGAMFERDMKETETGIVDIEDLEDDTVSKMLMFCLEKIGISLYHT
ncbi:hypothetical protein JTE90_006796 [Oedothorax gibbosus]|uniref:Uncharacterized protein n=1 Tax=Oedothorax gibbosus TaxID=931172 RepID=A0AAV6VMI1_9ARAC|nr:hypothetical protein JTE90_006796 [Oedothorax gibbosus]